MVIWQGAIAVLSTFVSVKTNLKTIYRQYRRTARSVEYVDNYQKEINTVFCIYRRNDL